jgi:putative cell wall-binding protein
LAGNVLAFKLKAPLLLIGSSDSDQQKVIDYIKSNIDKEGTVYILGGYGAVSVTVENKIADAGFTNLIRLNGNDRYETAVKIVNSLDVAAGTPIVLVNGENYPDALSISSEASAIQMPVL